MVRQARARRPDKWALIVGERRWTYAQLGEITDRIGDALLRRGIQPGDRVALHFSNGAEIIAFRLGATLLVLPRFEPDAVLRALEQHRVNVIVGLPVMYTALIHSPSASTCDLSSLEVCLAGGDAVTPELQRQFKARFGVAITEIHGMTEVCPCFVNPSHEPEKVGSIGRPVMGVSARLVNETGGDVAPGEVGEILVKSGATMVGYWADPAATAAALQEGWLRTGDLARQDEDGYITHRCAAGTRFVGRKKQIIIRGGWNISPLEVEEAISRHPAVKEAGVVGVPDATWGEIVQAYVALKDGTGASEMELQRFLKERIAAYKIPEAIRFLPELPKGLTGKVDRRALRDRVVTSPGAKAA